MSSTTNASKHLEGFEDTVKDFWASRPRRSRHGRKVAGVAVGVADRYDLDPTIVRVVLVAMTILSGIGVFVYLLGWLILPGEDDEVSAIESLGGRGRSSVSKPFTLLLCLLLMPTGGWAFTGSGLFDGGGFIGLALVVVAMYLLHRGRGHLNRPAAPKPVAHTSVHSGVTMPMSGSTQATTTPASPGWDPLGAAPMAWDLPDLPEPEPEPPARPPRRKSKIGAATFGLALVVGGVGASLMVSNVEWFSLAHVLGLVLGVLGIGMVAGAFAGGGRGLIWLAAPLAAAGLFLSSVPVDEFSGGVGPLDRTPRTAAEVLPVYERTVGPVLLDLRQLEGTAPVSTTVRTGAGPAQVHVPYDADVTYTCDSGAGPVSCLDHETVGVGTEALRGTDLGPDGEGGPRINLTVESAAGPVEVTRG